MDTDTTRWTNTQPSTTLLPVAIVGGGLSGLYTAHLLHKSGIPFLLYESTNRLGGPLHTAVIPGQDRRVNQMDVGSAWVWPSQDLTFRLLEELNCTLKLQYGAGLFTFQHQCIDIPLYPRQGGPTPNADLYNVCEGMSQVVARLVSPFVERVRMGHTLEQLSPVSGGWTLNFTCPTGPISFDVEAVVLAIPPAAAANIIRPMHTLPIELKDAIQLQAMEDEAACFTKIIAVYEKPFWREKGLSGSARCGGDPLYAVYDGSNEELGMYALVGMSHIQTTNPGGKGIIERAALSQLSILFGPRAKSPACTMLVDWSLRPWTNVVGESNDRKNLLRLERFYNGVLYGMKLTFAFSEAGHTNEEVGNIEGALNSGKRAADFIVYVTGRGQM